MTCELRWLGHGSWIISAADKTLLLDPFLDDSPISPIKADEVDADFILVSHGHFDHIADAEKIAKRTGATVISNYEICEWLARRGVQNTHAMNIGGSYRFPFGRLQMTPALHSSMLPDGSYGGNPCGFLLFLPVGNVYFACDTGLFRDMELIGEVGLRLAVLPVGDNFTMGPEDALRAVRLLRPRLVVPMHANTWPLIAQDLVQWADRVKSETNADPVVLSPGQRLTLQ